MEINSIWVAVGLGVIGAVLCSVLWIAKRDSAAASHSPDATDTAVGMGIAATQHHVHGPSVDSGSTGTRSAPGDGGSS